MGKFDIDQVGAGWAKAERNASPQYGQRQEVDEDAHGRYSEVGAGVNCDDEQIRNRRERFRLGGCPNRPKGQWRPGSREASRSCRR